MSADAPAADAVSPGSSVRLYTTGRSCMQCMLTRRMLDGLQLSYVEIDVTSPINDGALEFVTEELGYSQAPVVVVDDEPEHHWSGFRPDRLAALAALAAPKSPLVDSLVAGGSGPAGIGR